MAIAQMSNLVENRFVGVGAVASVLSALRHSALRARTSPLRGGGLAAALL